MEYVVESGYDVLQISFPTTNGNPPANLERKTWSGLTGVAASGEVFKTVFYEGKQGYGVSTSSL